VLEYKRRRDGHSGDVPVTDVVAFVQALRKESVQSSVSSG